MVSLGRRSETRRRDIRFPVSMPMQLQLEGQDRMFGETINISRRGLLCRMPGDDLPLFARARAWLNLPDAGDPSASVECEGVVFRVEDDPGAEASKRVALYFHRLEDAKARRIRDCMIRSSEIPDVELAEFLQTHQLSVEEFLANPLANGTMTLRPRAAGRPSRFLDCLEDLTITLVEEIREPLAGITGALETLAGSAFHQGAPYQEVYQAIFRDLGRVDDAVGALLSYCLSTPPRMRLLRFSRLVDDCLDVLTGLHVPLTSSHGPGQPMIWGDDHYLQQALLVAIEQFADLCLDGHRIEVHTFYRDLPEELQLLEVPRGWTESDDRVKCLVTEANASGRDRGALRLSNCIEEVGIDFPILLRNVEMHGGEVSWCVCANDHPALLISLPIARSLVH
ncbi:MAG: hypothetical protein Tsb0017_12250 [Geothermobacteraceae bacterium]